MKMWPEPHRTLTLYFLWSNRLIFSHWVCVAPPCNQQMMRIECVSFSLIRGVPGSSVWGLSYGLSVFRLTSVVMLEHAAEGPAPWPVTSGQCVLQTASYLRSRKSREVQFGLVFHLVIHCNWEFCCVVPNSSKLAQAYHTRSMLTMSTHVRQTPAPVSSQMKPGNNTDHASF